MIDLSDIKHIYIYPGKTDMRLGIFGLRKLLLEENQNIEEDALFLFCGVSRNTIKVVHCTNNSIWLYQNKLVKGKFLWPERGDKSQITKEQLKLIFLGISFVKSIENKQTKSVDFY